MSSLIVVLRRRLADPLAARVERGQTLVLVALAAAAILGMCALGIDLARLYDARSEAQNAADHAATTASFASCRLNKSPAAAISDGMAAANVNGFDNDGSTNTVSIAHISGTQFRANTTRTIDTSFAAVIGWANLNAAATALGDCTSGGGGGAAMFAGGSSCGSSSLKPIEISGSNNKVYGGVRSNEDINMSGSTNDFDLPAPGSDPFEYVGSFTNGGSGSSFETPTYPKDIGPSVPVPPWPSGWAPSDANAAMYATYQALAIANGTNFSGKITSITTDGVYYTSSTEGMDIGSVTGATRNVVLVAPNGPIKISASSKTFTPYNGAGVPRQNLLMVSGATKTKPCDDYVISIAGSSSSWNGLLWAPYALIEMNGSSNTAVNGGLIGHALRLNGSTITITYDATLLGIPEVLLLE